MNLSTLFEEQEPTTACARGGVWRLADVLPELLAKYDVSHCEPHQEAWIDPIAHHEAVVCGTR
jgi:hypothetical protein